MSLIHSSPLMIGRLDSSEVLSKPTTLLAYLGATPTGHDNESLLASLDQAILSQERQLAALQSEMRHQNQQIQQQQQFHHGPINPHPNNYSTHDVDMEVAEGPNVQVKEETNSKSDVPMDDGPSTVNNPISSPHRRSRRARKQQVIIKNEDGPSSSSEEGEDDEDQDDTPEPHVPTAGEPGRTSKRASLQVNVPGAVAKQKRGQGVSCHSCKTSKDNSQLFFCQNRGQQGHDQKKRRCRKKYCGLCLKRSYIPCLPTANTPLESWICPSCLCLCLCANCMRRDKGPEAVIAHKKRGSVCAEISHLTMQHGVLLPRANSQQGIRGTSESSTPVPHGGGTSPNGASSTNTNTSFSHSPNLHSQTHSPNLTGQKRKHSLRSPRSNSPTSIQDQELNLTLSLVNGPSRGTSGNSTPARSKHVSPMPGQRASPAGDRATGMKHFTLPASAVPSTNHSREHTAFNSPSQLARQGSEQSSTGSMTPSTPLAFHRLSLGQSAHQASGGAEFSSPSSGYRGRYLDYSSPILSAAGGGGYHSPSGLSHGSFTPNLGMSGSNSHPDLMHMVGASGGDEFGEGTNNPQAATFLANQQHHVQQHKSFHLPQGQQQAQHQQQNQATYAQQQKMRHHLMHLHMAESMAAAGTGTGGGNGVGMPGQIPSGQSSPGLTSPSRSSATPPSVRELQGAHEQDRLRTMQAQRVEWIRLQQQARITSMRDQQLNKESAHEPTRSARSNSFSGASTSSNHLRAPRAQYGGGGGGDSSDDSGEPRIRKHQRKSSSSCSVSPRGPQPTLQSRSLMHADVPSSTSVVNGVPIGAMNHARRDSLGSVGSDLPLVNGMQGASGMLMDGSTSEMAPASGFSVSISTTNIGSLPRPVTIKNEPEYLQWGGMNGTTTQHTSVHVSLATSISTPSPSFLSPLPGSLMLSYPHSSPLPLIGGPNTPGGVGSNTLHGSAFIGVTPGLSAGSAFFSPNPASSPMSSPNPSSSPNPYGSAMVYPSSPADQSFPMRPMSLNPLSIGDLSLAPSVGVVGVDASMSSVDGLWNSDASAWRQCNQDGDHAMIPTAVKTQQQY